MLPLAEAQHTVMWPLQSTKNLRTCAAIMPSSMSTTNQICQCTGCSIMFMLSHEVHDRKIGVAAMSTAGCRKQEGLGFTHRSVGSRWRRRCWAAAARPASTPSAAAPGAAPRAAPAPATPRSCDEFVSRFGLCNVSCCNSVARTIQVTPACKHLSLSGHLAVPAGCDEQFGISTDIDWGDETHARTANRATPATQPITMPAIWPPDSPSSPSSAGGGGGGVLPDSTAACSWACSDSRRTSRVEIESAFVSKPLQGAAATAESRLRQ